VCDIDNKVLLNPQFAFNACECEGVFFTHL
jgi:hypothetical protein